MCARVCLCVRGTCVCMSGSICMCGCVSGSTCVCVSGVHVYVREYMCARVCLCVRGTSVCGCVSVESV